MSVPVATQRAAIGLTTASALVVGNMIGSGMFLLPATLAPYGAASLLGWALSGVGAMLLACVFADLAGRHPRSGGPYAFARQAFGDATGFAVAWCYWVSTWCGNAAIAIAFVGNLGALAPAATATPLRSAACAVGALWLCTAANLAGVRSAGVVQTVTTALKLLPLFAIVLLGAWAIEPQAFVPFDRSGAGLFEVATATAALTLWAFLGLESATVPAEHVRDPQRTVPRATLVGTALAALATVLACTVVVALVPAETLAKSSAPFADAARALWGDGAALLFAAAAAIACFGALNGWVLVQGQVPYAAARDGLFPRAFARADSRGTPAFGLLASSVLATFLICSNYQATLVGLFKFSILLSTAAVLVPYLVCAAASFRIGAAAPGGSRGAIAMRVVAVLALVYSTWALIGTGREALQWGGVLVLAGVPLYLWQKMRGARG